MFHPVKKTSSPDLSPFKHDKQVRSIKAPRLTGLKGIAANLLVSDTTVHFQRSCGVLALTGYNCFGVTRGTYIKLGRWLYYKNWILFSAFQAHQASLPYTPHVPVIIFFLTSSFAKCHKREDARFRKIVVCVLGDFLSMTFTVNIWAPHENLSIESQLFDF